MFTLFFVKHQEFRDRQFYTIVTLETGIDGMEAVLKARERISDFCRDHFELCEVTEICQTPDEVNGFEPV